MSSRPYTFIGLVNEICDKVNEAPLTSSNFSSVQAGFYLDAKNSVNRAYRSVNLQQKFWRFNFVRAAETLIANPSTGVYSLPSNSRVIDFYSFVIPQDSSLAVGTTRLRNLEYDEYLASYIDFEYNDDKNGLPKFVTKGPGESYILTPRPDKAYTLHFDYFQTPTDLSSESDVPVIPEKYRDVIHYGAMADIYMFRDDENKAEASNRIRNEIVEQMRSTEINTNFNMRSGMFERDVTGNRGGAGFYA